MEYDKKDPKTQFFRMRDIINNLKIKLFEQEKIINYINIPKRSPLVYKTFFLFNDYDTVGYFNTDNLLKFVTLTFDQSFILPLTNEDQCNYFTEMNYENRNFFTGLFGVYEHHKSGIVHFHGVYEFSDEVLFEQCMRNFKLKLTKNSTKAVLSKPISNLNGLLKEYFVKESYLSIKLKREEKFEELDYIAPEEIKGVKIEKDIDIQIHKIEWQIELLESKRRALLIQKEKQKNEKKLVEKNI